MVSAHNRELLDLNENERKIREKYEQVIYLFYYFKSINNIIFINITLTNISK